MNRLMLAGLLTCAFFTYFEISADASVSRLQTISTVSLQNRNVVKIDLRCGRGRHFVRPHRRHGHLVRGYCARASRR